MRQCLKVFSCIRMLSSGFAGCLYCRRDDTVQWQYEAAKHSGYNDGMYIYIEPIMEFGYNINETVLLLKKHIIKEIEKLTSMNVLNMEIVIKGVHYEKKK